MMRSAALLLALLLAACPALGQTPAADLVIYGRVYTMDPLHPIAEAVVVKGGIVMMVGRRDAAAAWVGEHTQVLTAPESGAVLPGLIESHAHLLAVGRARRELDLTLVRSREELSQAVRSYAAKSSSSAIVGRGWNQELWPDRAFPTAADLDAAESAKPVYLTRVDGHAAVVNSVALAAAGIDASTKDPAGGRLERDADGRPTGVLIDTAMGLVAGILPKSDSEEDLVQDYLAAQELAFSQGITTFVDAGTGFDQLAILNRLYVEQRMKLRTYNMIGVNDRQDLEVVRAAAPLINLHGGRANARAIKLYADGALGSRGAWLSQPYADRPNETGFPVQDPAFIEEVARFALERGWQVCVHAIGDRANREVLDAFERAFKAATPAQRSDHRFRIEHVQILDPKDAPRFRQMGLIASMQGCHCTSDAPWVPARLGPERARTMAYTWRTLIDAGAIIANGTDAPVEPISPWRNFYSTVTRNSLLPDGTWHRFHEEQRMNRQEALQSMTNWAAVGIFEDKRLGELEPGREADLIIIDRDPMQAPLWHVARLNVRATILKGELVYRR